MKNIFTEHPNDIGETYFQHLKFALFIGLNLLASGFIFILHAIFPFIFLKTGSNILFKMTHSFVERMPRVEKKIVDISDLIVKKAVNMEQVQHGRNTKR